MGFPMPFLRTTSAPRRRRVIQLPFGISATGNFCNPCLHRAAAGSYNCHSVFPPVTISQTLSARRVITIHFATPTNSERSLFAFYLPLVLSPILFAIPARTDIITRRYGKRPPRREVFIYLIFVLIAGIIFLFKTLAALVFLFRNGFFGSLCRMISESRRLGKENVCFRHIHGVGRNDYLCGFAV